MQKSAEGLRSFDGAVALITGGASGLGKALAFNLAKRGCEVVLADRQVDLANDVAAEITNQGGKAHVEELDVTDHERFAAVVQDTKSRTGRLDYLFNNAGIAVIGEAADMTIEQWHSIIDVNIRGVANGVHAVFPLMQEQGYGHIINTASMAGLAPTPMLTSYAMTKHSVVGLSTSLRVEGAASGVRVSALCPGLINTPIIKGGEYGSLLTKADKNSFSEKMQSGMKAHDVDQFAETTIRAVARNKPIIVVPFFWNIFWWGYRFSPRLSLMFMKFTTARMRRQLQELPDASGG